MSDLRSFLTESPCQPEDSAKRYFPESKEQEWYSKALSEIPECGWHNNLMHVARAARRANVSREVFISDVCKNTPGGVLAGRVCEIERAYNRVDPSVQNAVSTTPEVIKGKPAPVILPEPLDNETERFLKAVFNPDETIVIAPAKFNPQKNREEPIDILRQARTRDEWISIFKKKSPSDYFKNDTGVYIKINPFMRGENDKGLPLADDASVTAHRWLLVEGDEDAKELQLGAFHTAGLPYATVVDSGGKSLHALIRLDAENHEDFKNQQKEIYTHFGKMIVVDNSNSSPSRYSRLPGCKRGKNAWQTLLEVYDDVPSVRENNRQVWLAGAFTLEEFYHMEMPAETTLLGNRFLCREGSMLFVGPSGIGKSSASVQCDVLWSMGMPAFGIVPDHPLKILCVQAENDDGDMIEMTRGVMHGLRLTEDQIRSVGENTLYRNYKDSTGSKFLAWLEKLVAAYRPDIVRIDPLQAYLGDDAKEVKAVADFCRNTLNPILTKYQAASIIAHHTPKTNHRDTSGWGASDWMYAGAGTADLTNWARCVMVIDPVGDSQDVFRFIAAKRWKRIGWNDLAGYPTHEKFFKHASGGSIYWQDADAPTKAEQGKKSDKSDLLSLLPDGVSLPKKVLISKAQTAGIGIHKCAGWIEELVFEKVLVETREKRKEKRDEILISKALCTPVHNACS